MSSPFRPLAPTTPRNIELQYECFAPVCPAPTLELLYGQNPFTCGDTITQTGLSGTWTASFTITNGGLSGLDVGSVTLTDGVGAGSMTLTQDMHGILAAGESFDFDVSCTPPAGKHYTGTLTIPNNAGADCLISFDLTWT